MIGRLIGRLASKATDHVIVDVAGVGYLVHIPLSTFYELPEAESPASLWIHTHVREDALALYGFLTERERSLFLLLLGVAGIGPRVALTVLSGIPPAELVEALRGLGRPPARGRAGRRKENRRDGWCSSSPRRPRASRASRAHRGRRRSSSDDVMSALVNLGYRKADAERAVDGIGRAGAPAEFGEYLKLALKKLTGG